MSLAKITPEVRKDLGLRDDAKGAAVLGLDENGPAAKRGILPGDVVVAIGRDAVTAPEQVAEKVEAARKAGRKSVLLRVERDGANQFFAVPVEPAKPQPAPPTPGKPPEPGKPAAAAPPKGG
jgi:serine protease Do